MSAFAALFSKVVCLRWLEVCLYVGNVYRNWVGRRHAFHWNLLQKVILSTKFVLLCLINPFPHIDAFWRLWSRRLFGNIVTKEEIAQNEQFLFLTQCFPLLVIGYPFNYRDFPFFDKICSKSSAAELSYEGKG